MAHNNQQLGLPLDQHQELQIMQNAQAVALNQWLEQFESTIVAAQAEQQKLNADCDAARDIQMQQLVTAMSDLQAFVRSQSNQNTPPVIPTPNGGIPPTRPFCPRIFPRRTADFK